MYCPIASLRGRFAGSFTSEEEKLFQQRYENGYDLSNDLRYISWLHIHHPEEAIRLCELIVDPTDSHSGESVSNTEDIVTKSTLSRLLQYPNPPPTKCVPPEKKAYAKVFTSAENLALLE